MLSTKEVMATVAVRDIEVARKFYEETLGLARSGAEEPGMLAFQCGGSTLLVYQSQYAATNKATSATWNVGDDIERIVAKLKAMGVKFEHYDFPDTRLEGDIHVSAKRKAAWLKDPDGNILNLAG